MRLGTDSCSLSADKNYYVNSGCREKKNCLKRYEMSKWSFYNAILMADWSTTQCHILHFIGIEIPDYAQINDELYTFSQTFLAKEPMYNLTLETSASFLICVLFLLLLFVANYLPNSGLFRHCHWTYFFKKHKYNIL